MKTKVCLGGKYVEWAENQRVRYRYRIPEEHQNAYLWSGFTESIKVIQKSAEERDRTSIVKHGAFSAWGEGQCGKWRRKRNEDQYAVSANLSEINRNTDKHKGLVSGSFCFLRSLKNPSEKLSESLKIIRLCYYTYNKFRKEKRYDHRSWF